MKTFLLAASLVAAVVYVGALAGGRLGALGHDYVDAAVRAAQSR